MITRLTLVGNPNTGKTTLFNTLTGANEKASNWHGVTVGVKSKSYNYLGNEFVVNDIPGIYSIKGYSKEEKIAGEYLEAHKDDLIINICDANNFKRNIILTLELLEKGYNVIVAMNMSNECKNYDYEKITKALLFPIIEIDARKLKSVKKIKTEIAKYNIKKPQIVSKLSVKRFNIDDFIIKNAKNTYKLTLKIDKIVLNKALFLPITFIFIFIIFFITYGDVGSWLTSQINNIFIKIANVLQKLIYCTNIPIILKRLLCEGVIESILSVVSFIPQIVLLMFFMNILEDIGIMSRFAFMLDGVLKKIGLTGKSLFSLMMGYGCTTTAIMTTRNLENVKLRKRTVCLLPFVSCSAKLPIFLTIASLFFERYKYLFVFGLYLFAIFLQIVIAVVLNKLNKDKDSFFLLEMPKYRFPNLKKILKDTLAIVKEFFVKVGTMIVFFSIIVWFLQNFNLKLHFISNGNFTGSILFCLSEKLSILFKPIGLNNAGIVISLLLGFLAKEMIVVSLSLINGAGGSIKLLSESLVSSASLCHFTPVSSIVFLVFVLLYSPCVSAMFSIKNELGTKTFLYVLLVQTAIAYLTSFVVYLCLTKTYILFLILALLIFLLLTKLMLKLFKKKKCLGDCYVCKKLWMWKTNQINQIFMWWKFAI